MRLPVIFPAVCAFVALILGLLCVFAGSKKGMLPDYDIIMLNTSRLGSHALPKSLLQTLEGSTDSSLSQKLGIPDFYALYPLDYCSGTFSSSGKPTTTTCSNTTSLYNWNFYAALQNDLSSTTHGAVNISLPDLHWPDQLNGALNDVTLALHVTVVLYCIGIIMTGLALFTAIFTIFRHRRILVLVNIGMTLTSFGVLMLASAVVTAAARDAATEVNKYGAAISLSATAGIKLISLSWAATLLMLLSAGAWVAEFLLFKRRERAIAKGDA